MSTTPEMVRTTIRTSNANIVAVGNTVLANTVRMQVWDGLVNDDEGDPVRLADVRLTVDQALSLVADLTLAIQNASLNEVIALRTIIASKRG